MARKVEQGPIPNAGLSSTDDRLWRLDVAPKSIYVAAPLPSQLAVRTFACELVHAGFHVTCRWLTRDFSKRSTLSWSEHVALDEEMGRIDVEDVLSADTLIILANQPSSSGGYHVELGLFLGAGKTNAIVVGERRNVFYWTEHVRFTHSVDGLVKWLQSPEHGLQDLPPVFDKFKYDGRLEDEAVTLPVDDLLRHYMELAVAAISSKIEGDLLQLYARFVDDVKVHAGSDAFACSMRANWLEAERQLKLLRAKNEVLLSYDKFVDDFWFLGDADLKMPEDAYLGLCLAGEAGEVAEKLKKAYRDHGGKVDVDDMVKELGDVLYYLTRYAHLLGNDLESVARRNVEKLKDRAARNALRGEGDHR